MTASSDLPAVLLLLLSEPLVVDDSAGSLTGLEVSGAGSLTTGLDPVSCESTS